MILTFFQNEVLNKRGLEKEWTGRIQLSTVLISIRSFWNTGRSSLPTVEASPLRLLKIRQAINYGFDRRKMMMYLRNSIGTPAEMGLFRPSAQFRFGESAWIPL